MNNGAHIAGRKKSLCKQSQSVKLELTAINLRENVKGLQIIVI